MMRSNARSALLAVVAASALGVLASAPAEAAVLHERGAIESVDGSMVKVKTREGKEVSFNLDDGWKVAGASKASMADIKPGTFIGTATTGEDTGLKALEVVVFPEALKGTGEGHYAWDLEPKTMMTNATVNNEVTGTDGKTVTLTYKGGEKKVEIKDGTPIVMLGAATKADLAVGAKVFIATPTETDGKLAAGTVVVGKDGVTPPM